MTDNVPFTDENLKNLLAEEVPSYIQELENLDERFWKLEFFYERHREFLTEALNEKLGPDEASQANARAAWDEYYEGLEKLSRTYRQELAKIEASVVE